MTRVLRTITLRFPFLLAGREEPHAPGTFEIRVDREEIDVVWEAYKTSTWLMLPSPGGSQAWPISEAELAALLEADGKAGADVGHPSTEGERRE